MSWHAREMLADMDRREHHAEWSRFASRLTPAERRRIRDGNYSAIVRPLKPAFNAGPISIDPRLTIWIDQPEIRRGKWRARIVHVQDFRRPRSSSPPGKRTRESLDNVTTLYGADGTVGEPEPMEAPDDNQQRARLKWATSVQDAIRDAA